mgnify:CR=1 FL=1
MTDTSLSAAAMQRAAAEVCAELADDMANTVLTGLPENARNREAMEAAATKLRYKIEQLPAPSPAALLAEAVNLPEVRSLVEAAKALSDYSRKHTKLGERWVLNQADLEHLEATLVAFIHEARHD